MNRSQAMRSEKRGRVIRGGEVLMLCVRDLQPDDLVVVCQDGSGREFMRYDEAMAASAIAEMIPASAFRNGPRRGAIP